MYWTAFGDKVFKEVIRVKEVMRIGPYSNRTGVILRRGRDTGM